MEEEDFVNAERELVPSVSVKELEHYKRVRSQFEKVEEDGQGKGKAVAPQKEGIPQWQQDGNRPKSSGKGKGKAVDRKGKGKAIAVSNGEDEDDDDEFYTRGGLTNGRDKGKGKAVDMGFQQGSADDDEGLYG